MILTVLELKEIRQPLPPMCWIKDISSRIKVCATTTRLRNFSVNTNVLDFLLSLVLGVDYSLEKMLRQVEVHISCRGMVLAQGV